MCMLFLHLEENPAPGQYRLIIANNRDEDWRRPTKSLAFWESNQDCISSLDMEPGREGGTWLAFSRNGRLASLLSILAYLDPKKQGRGFLAPNFLTSDKDMKSYLQEVAAEANEHNNFNLVLVDLSTNSIGYVNSKTKCPEILGTGSHVFSNSPIVTPWQKVVHNRSRFSDLVKQCGNKSQKENLVTSLFKILSDKTKYSDDQLVKSQGVEYGLTDQQSEERSAAFVWSPSIYFATITSSVILVDADGNCEYIERNLKIPSDPDNFEWTSNSLSFSLL